MPVRAKRNKRRQIPAAAVKWLTGQPSFWGLIPHHGWPFGDDELREFWRGHRQWALAEAERQGLPQSWQVERYG